MAKRKKIFTFAERCTGCLNCQLYCSFTYTRTFNPAQARIQIKRGKTTQEIIFTHDCNACGICAIYCAYGGISLQAEGAE